MIRRSLGCAAFALASLCSLVCTAQPVAALEALGDSTLQEREVLAKRDHRPQFDRNNLLYVAFTVDQADWPGHTTVAVSRMGYVLVVEGVATNRYHFASYSLPPAQLAEFMALLYDQSDLFALRSQARPRTPTAEVDWGKEKWAEPGLLRFEAAFSTPALMYLADSVYSDVSVQVASLIRWLRQWQTLTRQQWQEQQQRTTQPLTGNEVSAAVSLLETVDVEFVQHLMARLHLGLHVDMSAINR